MSFDEIISPYIKKYAEETESLVAKYLVETGLKPSEICLVERKTETGRVIYPDLKSKYEDSQDESKKD